MAEPDAVILPLGDGFVLVAAGIRRERNGDLRSDLMLKNGVVLYADRIPLNRDEAVTAWAAKATASDRPTADRMAGAVRQFVLPDALAQLQEAPTRRTQADTIVGMLLDDSGDLASDVAATVELFHSPNGDAYATIPMDDHRETHSLRSKAFRQWLARRFHAKTAKTPNAQALVDATNVLAGRALFDGPVYPVFVRLAWHEDRLYLDLGDAAWRVIEITAGDARLIGAAEVPVKFRRPSGLQALPVPDASGSLNDLDPFLNLTDSDEDADALLLIKGWLVGVFQPAGGRPILELNGEAGSAKTTTARLLRRIIDPCTVPLRTVPRDERDLIIAASNGIIVALDNLSDIKDWQSDALCRLSTGGGLGGRQLFTDLDEIVIDVQRPVILTGINPVNGRGDRLDRTIAVTLPPIAEHDRRTEAEVWRAFDIAHPRLLGGLLNAVAAALARYRDIEIASKPRLADFVAWVEAAAPALGWDAGEFVAAFTASRRNADAVAIEALPIGPAVLALVRQSGDWEGTASDLLTALGEWVDEAVKRDPDWPKRANRLSGQLHRLAPNLRQVGLWVGFERSGPSGQRTITLTTNEAVFHRQDRQSRRRSGETSRPDADSGTDDARDEDRQRSSDAARQTILTDDTDATDDGLQPFSETCCHCGAPLPPGDRYLCLTCRGGDGADLDADDGGVV